MPVGAYDDTDIQQQMRRHTASLKVGHIRKKGKKEKREKEKRIFDKIFAEKGTNCKKKYENDFIKFSYFGS